ncbi:MAG TPA: glycosyltransferase [Oligoflexia bacterium]|nr:glycosyltransferase [Oligoflexia bacterium]
MNIAIIHDWLVSQRGGENVLDAICEIFPRADLFTMIYVPNSVSPNIVRLNRQVSFLNRLPQAHRRYRHFLPLMPKAVERFDLSKYDLIISSSHCVAKGVLKAPGAFHLSYVHAPMRYMWDRFDEYFSADRSGILTRTVARLMRSYFQRWDQNSASRVDAFLANSNFIASKIKEYYGRDAQVVYPFCETENLGRARNPGKNFLMVTALVPYKRVDLAIRAFDRLGLPLIIVGDGPDRSRLEKLAGKKTEFLGALKNDSLADLYSKCRALVFPGIEDFGIVPIEAMAAGAPVIAFGAGGALETVTPQTGLFFTEPSEDSLIEAVQKFIATENQFSEDACRKQGRKFNRTRFQLEFLEALVHALKKEHSTKIESFLKTLGNAPEPVRAWSLTSL